MKQDIVLKNSTTLVVDDNLALARDIAGIIESAGGRAIIHKSIEEAFSWAESGYFDVALVDVSMMKGSEKSVVKKLIAEGRGAELLLLAGNAQMIRAINALSFGAYGYCLKPVEPASLVRDIQRAFRITSLTRRNEELSGYLRVCRGGLDAITNMVYSLLLVLDENGRIVQANKATADALGMQLEDLPGLSWFDTFIPAQERDRARQDFEKIKKTDDIVNLQTHLVRKTIEGGGETRFVRWRVRYVVDEREGDLVYALGLDISETQEIERRTRLTEKLAAVGTLSAGLAHEIRNPLNAAGLQLRLLTRRLEAVDADINLLEPVMLVQAELGRLSRLLGDFLQFARPSRLVKSKVDVGLLVQSVVEMESPALLEKGASIKAIIPDVPAIIEGDSEKIRQAVLNLIRNAAEASGKGNRIEARVDLIKDGVRICVSDDGMGIPEHELPRIFEPFYSTKPGGTGLGMSIVHSLVTLHGGDVGVDSTEGKGTRIIISLPAQALQ